MYSLSRYPYQPLQSDVPQIYTKKPFRMTNPSVSICVPNAQLPQLIILHFTGMSHSSGSGGATSKPNYNKHFPRSFMLNYEEALSNLPDEKILCRLFDWNCEWLSRPNIAISEMASTLKENWTNIMAYRGTVFIEEFVDDHYYSFSTKRKLDDFLTKPFNLPFLRTVNGKFIHLSKITIGDNIRTLLQQQAATTPSQASARLTI